MQVWGGGPGQQQRDSFSQFWVKTSDNKTENIFMLATLCLIYLIRYIESCLEVGREKSRCVCVCVYSLSERQLLQQGTFLILPVRNWQRGVLLLDSEVVFCFVQFVCFSCRVQLGSLCPFPHSVLVVHRLAGDQQIRLIVISNQINCISSFQLIFLLGGRLPGQGKCSPSSFFPAGYAYPVVHC